MTWNDMLVFINNMPEADRNRIAIVYLKMDPTGLQVGYPGIHTFGKNSPTIHVDVTKTQD
jgi:hypothetical protein